MTTHLILTLLEKVKNEQKMKKNKHLIIGVVTGVVFMFLIVKGLNNGNTVAAEKANESEIKNEDSEIAAMPQIVEEVLTPNEKRIKDSLLTIKLNEIEKKNEKENAKNRAKAAAEEAKLKRNFVVENDEFNNIEFYTHKGIGKYYPRRKTIYAVTSNSGYCYLVSNYFDDDWLFHSQVKVKFEDGIILQTDVVDSFNKHNRQDNDGGDVWENITYEMGEHIIRKIADNPKQRVVVRFEGRQFYSEVTLNLKDKQMIAETYQLADFFKN